MWKSFHEVFIATEQSHKSGHFPDTVVGTSEVCPSQPEKFQLLASDAILHHSEPFGKIITIINNNNTGALLMHYKTFYLLVTGGLV